MNYFFYRFVAISLLCSLAINSYAEIPPTGQITRIQASYDVFKGGLKVGQTTDQFERNGQTYKITSFTIPVGIATLISNQKLRNLSVGTIVDNQLQPKKFERTVDNDPSKATRAEFDWDNSQLLATRHGKTETLELGRPSHDRLSLMYGFMLTPPKENGDYSVYVSNGEKYEQLLLKGRTREMLQTPLGNISAIHLKLRLRNEDKGLDLWLAPDHHYLPVKMSVQKDKSDTAELRLSALTTQ